MFWCCGCCDFDLLFFLYISAIILFWAFCVRLIGLGISFHPWKRPINCLLYYNRQIWLLTFLNDGHCPVKSFSYSFRVLMHSTKLHSANQLCKLWVEFLFVTRMWASIRICKRAQWNLTATELIKPRSLNKIWFWFKWIQFKVVIILLNHL